MSENWAVCVGINKYDNLTPLDYAKQDAEAVTSFFKETARFKTVYFFSEDSEPIKTDLGPPIQPRPTYGNLLRFLRVRFDQAFLKPSDNLWFFFAGHGRRDRDQDYLLPMDADPGSVGRTGIEVRYVVEQLRKSGAGNIVLLLDACRNQGARDGETVGLERQKGAVTISSCSAAEFSYEIGDLRHGAFTYALLEGLRLHGERNCATVERLDAYLQTRVPEICRLHGKPRQTPCTLAEPLSKRHFILLPAVALPEDLQPLKVEALEAEALGDLPLADQIWWRIIAADPTDAQAREGARRVAAKLSEDDRNDTNDNDIPVTPAGAPLKHSDAKSAPSPPVGWRKTISKRKFLYAGALGTAGVAIGGLVGLPLFKKPRRTPTRSQQIMVTTVDSAGAAIQNPSSNTIDIFSQPIDGQASIEFSVIPGSDFWMGSPLTEPGRRGNEQQAHVKVGRVAISRTAVTQRQWLAVVQEHGRSIQQALPNFPSSFKGDDLPVETVSWRYASEFCARLAAITGLPYRLPTEAEWEHACRAGTTTPFHFGPTLTPDVANYCSNGGAVCGWSYGKSVWSDEYGGEAYGDGAYAGGPSGAFLNATKAVRSYPSNAFGLFEMHGNVWEHCLDDWTERVEDLPADGGPYRSGGSTQHPLRGGSWSHNPAICRSAYREWIDETSSGWEGRIGFRVACNL